VKRRKGIEEIISAIKDHNGMIITDNTEKDNILNSYYASVFCCDRNIPGIELGNSDETFILTLKLVEKDYQKLGETNQQDGVLVKF
jgi:hypothetical protein